MQIQRKFPRTRFDATAVEAAFEEFCKIGDVVPLDSKSPGETYSGLADMEHMTRWLGHTKEVHDDRHEYIAALGEPFDALHVIFSVRVPTSSMASRDHLSVDLWVHEDYSSDVTVTGPDRSAIARMLRLFERESNRCRLAEPEPEPIARPRIFVGHGRSEVWKDLRAHLQDQQGYEVEAYETGSRAGHTIRDVLDSMLDKSSFAVLVMTAEDVQPDGTVRARQNVVHEAGLFQGRLGFARVAILLEEGVETFSNVDGVQYIPFSGSIRETYGDVLAALRREFHTQ